MDNSMRKCPYCGEEILAVAKKCKHCGEWLNLDTKCPICGETIPADTTVCPVCGERIDADNAQNDAPQPNPQPIPQSTPVTPVPTVTTPTITPDTSFSGSAADSNTPVDEENKARGFFEYYFKDNFLNLKFRGNTPRRQYWMGIVAFALINFLFWGLIIAVSALLENLTLLYVGYAVYSIASLCTLPTLVRRLHDTGKSGWNVFVVLIPIVGFIWLLVLLTKKGEEMSKTIKINTTDKILFVLAFAGIISSFAFTGKLTEIMFDPYYEYETSSVSLGLEDSDKQSIIDSLEVLADQTASDVEELKDEYVMEELRKYIQSYREYTETIVLTKKAEDDLMDTVWPGTFCDRDGCVEGLTDDVTIIKDAEGLYHFACTCVCGEEIYEDGWPIHAHLRNDGMIEITSFSR